MVKQLGRLPQKIIVFTNKDKKTNEKWDEKREKNIANFPHTFRMLICGQPNSGKSNTLKNILIFQRPTFKRVMLWINDSTKEYDYLIDNGAERFNHMPSPDEFDPSIKTVLIIDDINLRQHDPEEFSLMLRNYSSHLNFSLILTIHDNIHCHPFNRRLFNVFIIYKSVDMLSISQMAQKIGLHANDFKYIMYDSELIDKPTDFICIDNTSNTKFKLRKNLFEPIEIKENENGDKEFIHYKNAQDFLDNKT